MRPRPLRRDGAYARRLTADFLRFYPIGFVRAYDALPHDVLWALIDALPPDSAYSRGLTQGWDADSENLATLVDLLGDTAVRGYQRGIFDPKAFASHKRMAEEAKLRRRDGIEPDWLPSIPPLALRPPHASPIVAAFERANSAKRSLVEQEVAARRDPRDSGDGLRPEAAPVPAPAAWSPTRVREPEHAGGKPIIEKPTTEGK